MKEFEGVIRKNRAAALKNRLDEVDISRQNPRPASRKTAAPDIAPVILTRQTARIDSNNPQNRAASMDIDALSRSLERDSRRYPRAFTEENEGEEE